MMILMIMMMMIKMSLVGSTVEKLPFGSNPTAPLTHCNCHTQHDDNDDNHDDDDDYDDYEYEGYGC